MEKGLCCREVSHHPDSRSSLAPTASSGAFRLTHGPSLLRKEGKKKIKEVNIKEMRRADRFRLMRKRSRELRKEQTRSEAVLWKFLRNRRLSGYKFLRQHPIVYRDDNTGTNFFIADFYCSEKKAVIELDGGIHEKTAEYDNFRDDEMKRFELKILRIKNDSLADMAGTLNLIKSFLNSI